DPYADLEPALKVHAAACNNDIKMLEKLAEAGVDFNTPRPQDGYYALDACAWSGNFDSINMLIRHGADASITLQAVVGAASWGSPEMLEALISAGGPINQELCSESALRWAVQFGHEDCAILLVKKGAWKLEPNQEILLLRAKGKRMRQLLECIAQLDPDRAADCADLQSTRYAIQGCKVQSIAIMKGFTTFFDAKRTGFGGFAAGFAAGAAAAAAGRGEAVPQGGVAGFSSWLLMMAQSLFDVSTDDVVRRLKLIVPYPAPDGSAAEELRARPDFYGPFWVATTAVLFLAATGNFARLIESPHPSLFKADYSLVPLAASIIYGGLIAVPLLARVSVFFTDEEVANIDFKKIVCVCGYGLAPAIPVSILCIIPVGFLRWLFVMGGLALSLLFLKSNLLQEISVKVRWLQLTLLASPVLLQVLVFFVYRVRFFAGDRD
ncbi:unnamed protein product, partial [Effrenium voratum]